MALGGDRSSAASNVKSCHKVYEEIEGWGFSGFRVVNVCSSVSLN